MVRQASYTERTTENVVDCLTQWFPQSTAIRYDGAVSAIVTAFACQRTTAEQLLESALDDGVFYRLTFRLGALGEHTTPEGTTTKLDIAKDGLAYFVANGASNYGLVHDNDPSKFNRRVADGATAVAVADRFESWLEQYKRERQARQAEMKALEEQEDAQARAAHPELAAVMDLVQLWEKASRAQKKGSPIEASLGQRISNNSAIFALRLYGPRADAMAADLLAVLHKHYPASETLLDDAS